MNFRRIVANPGLKFLALALATLYWVLISAPRRERTFERAFEIPLALVGVPHDLVITSPVRDTVHIRLRGPLSALRAQSSQTLEATLDLSNITKGGESSIPILPQALNVPPGVSVVAVEPPRIAIRLEPRRQKVVPIREFLVGQLPSGYEVGQVVVSPSTALVSGAASMIKTTVEVATERIILSGRVASFRRTVGLVADTPQVQIVEPSLSEVFVEVIPPATLTDTASVNTGPDATVPPPTARSASTSPP